jgi:hypothetical protein
MLWRVQQVRIDFLQLRARIALAASKGTAKSKLLGSAERDAQLLEKESATWGKALGSLLRACVDATRTQDQSPDRFAIAAAQLEEAQLGVFAAAAKYRQGERTAGNEGQQLLKHAFELLTGEGVRDPLRTIQSHAPIGERA